MFVGHTGRFDTDECPMGGKFDTFFVEMATPPPPAWGAVGCNWVIGKKKNLQYFLFLPSAFFLYGSRVLRLLVRLSPVVVA